MNSNEQQMKHIIPKLIICEACVGGITGNTLFNRSRPFINKSN